MYLWGGKVVLGLVYCLQGRGIQSLDVTTLPPPAMMLPIPAIGQRPGALGGGKHVRPALSCDTRVRPPHGRWNYHFAIIRGVIII
jgi:hypothetical protein